MKKNDEDVICKFANESGFYNGVPLTLNPDPVSDALEIEIRHSMSGTSLPALQAMLHILRKTDDK